MIFSFLIHSQIIQYSVINDFQTPVSVAFTPTSVIRKMHSEKASEKEKQKTENSSESDTQGM